MEYAVSRGAKGERVEWLLMTNDDDEYHDHDSIEQMSLTASTIAGNRPQP
jgi:hypothetical protein